MMQTKLKSWIFACLFALGIGGGFTTLATAPTASAANCTDRVLTFPTWYRGISESRNNDCLIKNPNAVGGIQNFIIVIVLNVVEIILQLVVYVSVGYIIFGGFKYMISQGRPEDMTKAKTTILNAVIGLGISLASVVIVNIVANAIR